MSIGLIIIIVIFGIILIAIAVLILTIKPNTITTGGEAGVVPVKHCVISPSDLPNLTSANCCVIFGSLTNSKFLSSLNLVVSPVATNYLDVCSGFCRNGLDTSTIKCNGGTNQENSLLESCIQASKPVNCNDLSQPVAIDGITYLYPSSAGNQLCLQTAQCAL